MSGTSLQYYPVVLPNPISSTGEDPNSYQRIDGNYSFTYTTPFNSLTTLSTTGVRANDEVVGLFYVPELASSSACINASAPYVPVNATTREELPSTVQGYLVAVAPWVSPDCTLQYLAAVAGVNIRGFVFFLPDNGTDQPPEESSNVWDLGDGGLWKTRNNFPVYALPGQTGTDLMSRLAAYSGNMTDVPYGADLTQIYEPDDYVRIFVGIDTAGGAGSLPSLWVFLLIVLGILLVVIGFTSLLMHILQRRRRRSLRQRVANGEVDLELLGIRRLTVPQDLLDKMPQYKYGTGSPVTSNDKQGFSDVQKGMQSKTGSHLPLLKSSVTASPPASGHESSYQPSPLQQPTCAICLDDFVVGDSSTDGTTVRELPCHHIFHPECVDTFLKESSSLCPICKRSTLPKGYCPRVVTNAMVRRERVTRRMRERGLAGRGTSTLPTVAVDDHISNPPAFGTRVQTRVLSGFSNFRHGRQTNSAPTDSGTTTMTEMVPVVPGADTARPDSDVSTHPQIQPPSNSSRREWARQRAVAMVGRDAAPSDLENDEARTTPAWRKALRGIFPVAR